MFLSLHHRKKHSAPSLSPPQEAIESNAVTLQPQAQTPQLLLRTFTNFAAMPWTHSRTFTSFLNDEAQNYAQYSRWGCTGAEYSRVCVYIPLQGVNSTSQSGSISNLLMVHSTHSVTFLINILNRTGPGIEPWGTPLKLMPQNLILDLPILPRFLFLPVPSISRGSP